MTQQPRSSYTTEATNAPTRSPRLPVALKQLRGLQQAGRLGLHAWEGVMPGQLPDEVLGALSRHPPRIPEHITPNWVTHHWPEMISLSLVPTPRENGAKSVHPFLCNDGPDEIGYLFDLTQEQEIRPIIAQFREGIMNSGPHIARKELKPWIKTGVPAIEAATKNKDEATLLSDAAGAQGAAIANSQFDGLQEFMHQNPNTMDHPGLCYTNELVAILHRPHLKAIYMAYYPEDPDSLKNSKTMQKTRLHGAIAGLQHLEKGDDLPVVIYHITGPQQGEIEWLGQGREALRTVALDALEKLAEQGEDFYRPGNPMQKAVAEVLGIDLLDPLSPQLAALAPKRGRG